MEPLKSWVTCGFCEGDGIVDGWPCHPCRGAGRVLFDEDGNVVATLNEDGNVIATASPDASRLLAAAKEFLKWSESVKITDLGRYTGEKYWDARKEFRSALDEFEAGRG